MQVFYAATRGKRYEIKVRKSEIYDDVYCAECFTHGQSQATMSGYNKEQITKRIVDEIINAKRYDNINYIIHENALGVTLPST